jgi:plasmid stability protein
MATLRIRQLDDKTKSRLRVRAAHHGRSMQEEAREILRSAQTALSPERANLAETIHGRFAEFGEIEFELPRLMRSKPCPSVLAWVARQPATELCTTSITEAEILRGIEMLIESKRREALLEAADAMFAGDLADRNFGFESDAARVFSKIVAHRRAVGSPISHADA